MSFTPSSPEEVKAAILAENPFDRPRFLKKEDIWTSTFPDVPEINKRASDVIFESIESVKNDRNLSFGLFISADRGFGKSHLVEFRDIFDTMEILS
jgi:hypothetical protein